MRDLNYILEDDGTIRPAKGIIEFGRWYENAKRHIGNTIVFGGQQTVRISTVFLGLDHNYYDDGPPLVFETMVFDSAYSNHAVEDEGIDACIRYPSLEEAWHGHEAAVAECLGRYGGRRREDPVYGYHPAVRQRWQQ